MFGRPGAERKVSLRSGAAVAECLGVRSGHESGNSTRAMTRGCLPPGTGWWSFSALHRTYGEDGTVQRRLDELGAAFTPVVMPSERASLSDKVLTKKRCIEAPGFQRRNFWS